MTVGNLHPGGRPPSSPTAPLAPAPRCRGPQPINGLSLFICLLVWPVVFASAVIGTFFVAAITYDDFGGPLFWPLGWVGSAVVYLAAVGGPLVLCTISRRWFVRLIPAVLVAVPVVWFIVVLGGWSVPAMLTVAISILLESTGWRQQWMS